tara:strand:+ start:287 stop:1294 length:1008 start_codon:yes stop_codon:yes gene_type:complete
MIIVPGGSAGDIEAVTAGDGLSGGGNSGAVTVTLDLNELTAAAVADGDSIPIIDANDSNASRKESVADLATLFAGDGLAASSSVIGVDLGTNPGLEIDSNKLQIAKGISQHDVPQFTSGVADDDFLRVDGTTIEGRSASEVLSDIGAGAAAGSSSIVTTGALDAGSITSNFGSINNGSSAITTTGTVSAGNVTLGDTGQLIIGDDAPSSDHTATGVVITMTALTGLAIGEAVYIDSNGKLDETDADAAGTMPAIGVALEANSSGSDAEVKVLLQGVFRDDTYNFTPGADLFIGTNLGEITATAPSGTGDFVQKVGVALTADTIYFNPSLDLIEHA